MKKLLLLIGLLASFFANAQTVQYSLNSPGPTDNEKHTVATDSQGNVYSLGTYAGTLTDFDPGAGVFNMSAISSNLFILKLDAAGNFVWAKQIGGTTSSAYEISLANSLTIDSSNNIYFSGQIETVFGTTVDVDMSSGISNLTLPNQKITCFMEKLDSSGNFVWAKSFNNPTTIGGNIGDVIQSIKVDATGTIYAIGNFTGTPDFDPNAGVFNLTAVGYDILILKLDSSGSLIWAKSMPGNTANPVNTGYDISLDSLGNIYTVGYFSDSIDSDPGAGVHTLTGFVSNNPVEAGGLNLYVSKLDNNGNYVWAYSLIGDHSITVHPSMVIDSSNNILISGYTNGVGAALADFDFGPGTYYLPDTTGSFILKINSDANFIWAKSTANRTGCCNSQSYSNGISLDSAGNIYTIGDFYAGTYDFDPSASTFLMTPNTVDLYVSKLDIDGNFVWAKQIGGNGAVLYSGSLAIAPNGTVIISGRVASGSFTKSTAAIGVGGYLGAITQPALATNQFENNDLKLAIYPNPTNENLNINLKNTIEKGSLKIISITGQTVFEQQNINGTDFNFEVSSLNSGLYLIQVSDSQNTFTSKFIKQ